MEEEKQALMGDTTPSSSPPTYTPAPTQYPQPHQAQAGYSPQTGYPPQQQQQGAMPVVTGVPVPQREVWRGGALPEPDPSRVVIAGGTALYRSMFTSTSYTYADQLPCLTSATLVFIFLCFFLGTPLSLVCSVPAYIFINKANEEANTRNDIPAARDSYRIYKFSVWGLSFWFGIVLGLAITLGIMGGVGVFTYG